MYIDIFGDIYPCACSKEENKICNIVECEKVINYIKLQSIMYRTNCLNSM